MSIPEEMIMQHLDSLLSSSDPGDELQHLHIVSAKKGAAVGPLGIPDPSDLEAVIVAIVPDTPTPLDVPDYIRKVVAAMAAQHAAEGKTVMFAAVGQEVWTVDRDHHDELARRLQREGRLSEHPDVAEMTIVYGACRDGRRWRGFRYLTGPRAGEKIDANMIVGPVRREETSGIVAAPGILSMVGLR